MRTYSDSLQRATVEHANPMKNMNGLAYISLTLLLVTTSPAFAVQVGVAACNITPDVKGHEVSMAAYDARNLRAA